MIGTNLNLDLPSLSDTYAQALAKTAAGLSAIQDSLADRATPAALNINAPLDFGGNAITNCTSVQLASGNTPNVAGSLFYLNGEFYAVDATGVVQITANGQLNAASIGGIGGDYGGINPAAVTFDEASSQYRFYEDGGAGTWADVVARSIILEGTNGDVQIQVDDAINTSRILSIKSLPGSGVKLLVYNAATSTLEDASVTNPDALSVAGDVTATGTVTADKLKFSGTKTLIIGAAEAQSTFATASGHNLATNTARWGLAANSNPIVYPVKLPVGARITGYKVFFRKVTTSATTITTRLYKTNSQTGTETSISAGISDSGNADGLKAIGESATEDVAVNNAYYITAKNDAVAPGDQLFSAEVTYTTPTGI